MTSSYNTLENVGIASYALFLCAQLFKTMPMLQGVPIDLTVLSLLVTYAFILLSLPSREIFIPKPFFLLIIFFVFTAIFGYEDYFITSYASEKYSRFHLLTLPGAVAPLFLISNNKNLRMFLLFLVLWWVVYSILSFIGIYFTDVKFDRTAGFQESVIFLGRTAGSLLLVLTVLFVEKKVGSIPFVIAVFVLLVLILSSGSKAPIIASVILILLYMIVFVKVSRQLFVITIIVLIVILIVPVILDRLPESSIDRIMGFIKGDIGEGSGEIRLKMWADAIEHSFSHIWGIGLGGFYTIDNRYISMSYPHNILIECMLEVGVFTLIIFLMAIYKSTITLYKNAKNNNNISLRITFILMVYFFLQSLSSADLDGNRIFFSFLSIGLMGNIVARSKRGSLKIPLSRNIKTPGGEVK